MSTGGIFQLISNDGKQDKMLMSTDFLNARLAKVSRVLLAKGEDPTPKLKDIEKSHVLFMHAHYKPFAACGYEYNKVRSTSGTTSLNTTVQFSIPQFGDFFHDMVLHVILAQPTKTDTGSGGNIPTFRWCNFPGERLCQKVAFQVNGNPLDEYTWNAMNFHREFNVPSHKKVGWYRCVGQELPHKGHIQQPNWVGNGSATVSQRMVMDVSNGNQTPTTSKSTSLEMFIPLLFWFNRDPRLSVPSVAIPYGQRFVEITLATGSSLVGTYPRGTGSWASPAGSLSTPTVSTIELYVNNIFVMPEIHRIFMKRIGFSMVRVHREQTYTADKTTDDILLQKLKWPVEFIYVGMRVKAYTSTTAATERQHLDKWHSFSQVTVTEYTTDGWDIGYKVTDLQGVDGTITIAHDEATATAVTLTDSNGGATAALSTYVAAGDIIAWEDQNLQLTVASATATVITCAETQDEIYKKVNIATGGDDSTASLAAAIFTVYKKGGLRVDAQVCARTVDLLTVKSHGINLYNAFPAAFYNAYIPYQYGGQHIATPEDCGAMMVNFALYPGSYQPSGHINVSRAREFYVEYTSSVISSSTNGILTIVASAINFLLISDGSATMRYTT